MDLRQRNTIAHWAYGTRSILGRFHNWLGDGNKGRASGREDAGDSSFGPPRDRSFVMPAAPSEKNKAPASPYKNCDPRFQRCGSNGHVFVAMPFSQEMNDVFRFAIKGPIESLGYSCVRIDKTHFVGDINGRIKECIRDSAFVVAELTGGNPNVRFEVGYAQGCEVPTVLLIQDPADLGFDLQSERCLVYDRIKLGELADQMKEVAGNLLRPN